MSTLSIDVGTTVTKVVVYDDDGPERIVLRRTGRVDRPRSGHAERDPDALWDDVAALVRDAVEAAGHRGYGPVRHVSTTAQGDGAWFVDEDGRASGPAILWLDGRATAIVDGWRRDGSLEAAFARSGSASFPGLLDAIATWCLQEDPERLDRSRWVTSCNGWLHGMLTGRVVLDPSDASAPFSDRLTGERHATSLLAMRGLESLAGRLPPVVDGADRVTELHPDAAERLGLPAGLPVVLAPYDVCATAVGVGASVAGRACAILGTTICTQLVRDEADLTGPAAGLTLDLGVDGLLSRAMPSLAGGDVLAWACDLLDVPDAATFDALVERSDPGAGGLLFLPYLASGGERAPFVDPNASGALLGLSVEHTREQIARAVLEGLTSVIEDGLRACGGEVEELRVSGGGARSDTWLRLLADVTGRPVRRTRDDEVGARGADVLARALCGTATDVEAATRATVRLHDVVEPDADEHERHRERIDELLTLRERLAAGWPGLARRRRRDQHSVAAGPDGHRAVAEARA